MIGYWVLIPPQFAEKHYNELTGFNQKDKFIPDIVKRNINTRRDKMFEVGTREEGLTRKTKSEIIAYCEENGIPYSVEEYEYINVW